MTSAVLTAIVFAGLPATAEAKDPALHVPAAKLRAALHCSPHLRHAKREPVLLVHGTGGEGREAWVDPVNFQASLSRAGFPSCYVTLPDYALGDLQTSAEYVVASIRTMRARAGRTIAVYGHSQGGLLERWALTYWPSLRRKVADAISVAGPQHGTTWGDTAPVIHAFCQIGCPPAFLQQTAGSKLLAAINARRDETPGKTQWTTLRSTTDELVQPANGPHPSAALKGAVNIAIQHVCPGREVRHSSTQRDSVSFAALIDALRHRGPVKLRRLPKNVCAHRFAPGINDATADQAEKSRTTDTATRAAAYGHNTRTEPAVRPYAR